MTSAVPLRYRLAVRQSVPILTGLVGLLSLLLVFGYLYAREQIINTARAQMRQFVGSISRQDAFSRLWLERGMHPLAAAVEQYRRLPPERRQDADAHIASMVSNARGYQAVDIVTLDGETMRLRRYDNTGPLPLAEGDAPAWKWTPQAIRELRAPLWHPSSVDGKRRLNLIYSIPLTGPDGTTHGVLTSSLSTPWFAEGVHSSDSFKNSIPFFLTADGEWTLGPSADEPLRELRAYILQTESGDMTVRWEDTSYIVVFLPATDKALAIGVLIPRADLLGHLDAMTRLLALTGLIVLSLAAYGLHRTSLSLLGPLKPLAGMADRLARGELDSQDETPPAPVSAFPSESEKLRIATEQLRLALRQRVHDLTLMARTRERLFGELAFARTLQEALRPATLPSAPGLDVAARVHTAREVCGDMYDCFFLTPRRIGCVMGNVAERGVPAALLTGRVFPLLHELLLSGLSPGRALENVNRALSPQSDGDVSFISVFAGILHLDDGTFRWASAGQLPPFRRFEGRVGQLPWSGNVPLGIRASEQYEEQETRLCSGESLLFASQRLLSVPDPSGRAYGEDALRAFLAAADGPPEKLLHGLLENVRAHAGGPPRDDLVLFAVRWEATSGVPA